MLMDPLPQNQNMNSRTVDPGSANGGRQNPQNNVSGHGCINMMVVENFVTHAEDYGMLQLDLGKQPAPLESPLHIENPGDKPEAPPRIPKGVLKHSGHSPNSQVAQNYSIVEDLG